MVNIILMEIAKIFVKMDYSSIKLPVYLFVLLVIIKIHMGLVSKEFLLFVTHISICKEQNVFRLVQLAFSEIHKQECVNHVRVIVKFVLVQKDVFLVNKDIFLLMVTVLNLQDVRFNIMVNVQVIALLELIEVETHV